LDHARLCHEIQDEVERRAKQFMVVMDVGGEASGVKQWKSQRITLALRIPRTVLARSGS
jgi:hypothetical protein